MLRESRFKKKKDLCISNSGHVPRSRSRRRSRSRSRGSGRSRSSRSRSRSRSRSVLGRRDLLSDCVYTPVSAAIANGTRASNLSLLPAGLVLAATKDATVPVRGPEGTPESENPSLAGPVPDPASPSPARAPGSRAPVRLSASPAQRADQR